MPVLSMGSLLQAAAGYDQTKKQAEQDALNRMYSADYRRYLRDRTAYQADVERQRDQALLNADRHFDPMLANALRASGGKQAAQVAGLSLNQAWKQQAADARDPNRAAFLANLGGARVDPRYGVSGGVRYGRYDGSIATTPVGKATIAEKMARAAADKARIPVYQSQIDLNRARTANVGAGGQKDARLSTTLLRVAEDMAGPLNLDDESRKAFAADVAMRATSLLHANPGMGQAAALRQAMADLRANIKEPRFFGSASYAPTFDAPVAPEQPPVAGARKAPDGHWYVQKDGKWYRVER